MKTTMTIEQLAEKLKASIWEKGNLKRIYLNDAGWNTKKMRTTTYIFKNEEDEFVVVCKIECPSQGWGWIKSQQEDVKESIYSKIESAVNQASENGETTVEAIELPFSEDIEQMKEMEQVGIIKNEHYNPRLTPVTHVANLSDSKMIDFYRGCGKGIAYVKNDKVVAYQYGFDKFSNAPEGCKRVRVEFSCTQICFEM